jgi:tellurite resistance protein
VYEDRCGRYHAADVGKDRFGTPTLAIEVAPPALAGLAYLAITHGRVDAVALALGGFTTLTVIVQLRLIPVYRRLAFGPAFW